MFSAAAVYLQLIGETKSRIHACKVTSSLWTLLRTVAGSKLRTPSRRHLSPDCGVITAPNLGADPCHTLSNASTTLLTRSRQSCNCVYAVSCLIAGGIASVLFINGALHNHLLNDLPALRRFAAAQPPPDPLRRTLTHHVHSLLISHPNPDLNPRP